MTTAAAADDHSKHDTTAEVQEVYLLILLPSLVSKITITEWKAHDLIFIHITLYEPGCIVSLRVMTVNKK